MTDILLKVRANRAALEGKGVPETRAFLDDIANEISTLRVRLARAELRLRMLHATDTVVAEQVNGHG